MPIRISLESNSLFNIQTKTLLGTHLDYRFSENFSVGATLMNLTETPLNDKVNMGDEPISNTIWGLNTSYRTQSQFLTSLIDKLPFLETKQPSSIMLEGEFAHLIPGQANVIGKNGVASIDDFEAAQTKIDIKYFSSWRLASPPKNNPEFWNSGAHDLGIGYGRAKLAWYVIDPLFYRNGGLNPGSPEIDADLNSHYARRIREKEIFPTKESDLPGENFISILNLAYYPEERGPYNYDPNLTPEAKLVDPEKRWAGIMREIINSDFETSNIEFIEFWLMDPFLEDPNHSGGDLYIQLGEISEDILPDSRKAYEGGLPTGPDDTTGYDVTIWGHVPSGQAYMNTFAGEESRQYQDIGLDGLNDAAEEVFFNNYLQSITDPTAKSIVRDDVSADDFEYFLSDEHDVNHDGILERYKNFNNLEGNSPPMGLNLDYTPSNSNEPDIEDINNDNTLNTVETYFQYHVSLRPQDLSQVGRNFIVDEIEDEVPDFDTLARWYQFRIPLAEWESKMGDIEDFKSIRFIRLMLSGFEKPVVLRFATFDLLRGEWRRYNFDISETDPDVTLQPGGTTFEVSAVNIEENSERIPVNYVLPPGVDRLIDPGNPQVAHLNEQSLSLKIENLEDGDARAVFKNVQLDLRQYKKLQMFTHAEALPEQEGSLRDYEITAFIRIGSDYKNNYYEFELPLKVTPHGSTKDNIVWPDHNTMELIMNDFVELKKERNEQVIRDPLNYSVQSVYSKLVPVYENGEIVKYNTMKVKGNPNLGNIRQIMLGIRNPGDVASFERINDGLPKSAEVWFNELRVRDFDNRGGWAANGRVQAQLADFGIVNVAGSTSTPGFGSIEEKVDERSMEQVNQYDISTNLELGKFFPEKANVSIPLYFGTSKNIVNPEYFPKDPDIKFEDILAEAENKAQKDSLKQISQDLTSRASINITNVRWNKRFKKIDFLSPANLTASIGYSQTLAHNYSTEYNNLWKYNANLNYSFNTRPKNIQPFKKSKALKKPAFQIIRDFNFNPYPSRLTLSTQFDRDYQEMKMRNVFEDIELLIEPTVNKDFIWDRKFEMMWDITRALKFNYSAITSARIDEPQGQQDLFKPNNDLWKSEVWKSITEGGRNMNYMQKSDISYTVPINKIPIFNWINLNTSYGTTYNWLRGEIVPGRELGNTIKNSNSIKVSSNLNLRSMYSKFAYLKNLEAKYSKSKSSKSKTPENVRYKEVRYEKRTFFRKDEPKTIVHKLNTKDVEIKVLNADGTEVKVNTEIINENKVNITASTDLTGVTVVIIGKIPRGINPAVFIAENGIRMLTGFKSINISWMQSSGSILPGFLPETNVFGMNLSDFYGAPGWPFVFGIQDTGMVRHAIDNNWLTGESTFSKPFEFNRNKELNIRATFEPFKGLRVDINASRSYSESNEQLFFHADDELANYHNYYVDHIYTGGSFSISVITLSSAFEHPSESNNWYSPAFSRLSNNRSVISARRYRDRINSNDEYHYEVYHGDAEHYFDGYGPTSQEVLVPAFLSAYTGIDPEKVTLESFFWTMMPNWKISFDGLSELEFIKKFLKTITLTHSYKSTYSITGFGTNVSYFDTYNGGIFNDGSDLRSAMRDNQLDYIAKYQYSSVSIKEQLNPLIGFDMTWHNSLLTKFEISNTRMILLSLNNNQVNETRNNDYTIGAGYRFKEVPLNITAGGTKRQITSDLNVRFDVSLRNNVTIIRFLTEQLDEENDYRVTTGAKRVTMGLTADYVFSKSFNVQFFFDREVNTPFTTTTFRTAETRIGLSLRLSL
jgi:cell surface protein SprA